jgi:hypothetical protein
MALPRAAAAEQGARCAAGGRPSGDSGIAHVRVLVAAAAAYGPRKTLYNRFVRRAAKGIWAELFGMLAAAGGPLAELLPTKPT